MPPNLEYQPAGYAAFRLRFRALLLDGIICLLFFIIGGLAAGAVLEQYPLGRAVSFVLIILACLFYDPLMVSQYGGTFGHRALNIRVVKRGTQANLTFPTALLRALIKSLLGLLSFAFMFVTNRAQSLHDLAAGSEVRIRNPKTADAGDYFVPEQLPAGSSMPSALRRIVVVTLYDALLFILTTVVGALSVSRTCIELDICTSSEEITFSITGFTWLIGTAILIGLGWKGRLPGCRKRRA